MSIALLTAIGLLQAGSLIGGDLSACSPQGVEEAAACLDRRLSTSDRKAILAAPYEDMDDQFGGLREQIVLRWLAGDSRGLRAELKRYGAVLPEDQAKVVLQSYWLSAQGCDLDLKRQTRRTVEKAEVGRKVAAQEAEAAASGDPNYWNMENEPGTYGFYRYRPRCPSFVRGAL